jgi:hypothetical protein
MLVVLERYKAFLIILAVVALAILLWLFISAQDGDRAPSRGVFVLLRLIESLQGGDV